MSSQFNAKGKMTHPYTAYAGRRERHTLLLRTTLSRWSRTISGSSSSRSSSYSELSEDGSQPYSTLHIVASTGIATATGSPTAASGLSVTPAPSRRPTLSSQSNGRNRFSVSELIAATSAAAAVGGSPTATSSIMGSGSHSRRSVSSTIRKFFESNSSLSSSQSKWSTSVELPPDEIYGGIQEEDYEMSSTTSGDCLGAAGGDPEEIIPLEETPNTNFLQIPNLRGRASFRSVSTTETVMSGVGGWDRPSEASSPTTDVSSDDDEKWHRGSSRGLEESKETPLNQLTMPQGHAHLAVDPRALATDRIFGSGQVEILDHLLGHFDSVPEVIRLQQVCKAWRYALRHSEIFHSFIYKNYSFIRPGPGDIRVARRFADLKRVARQDKAIKEGDLMAFIQVKIPVHSPRVRHHSGYACFITMDNPGEQNEIAVYAFHQWKKKDSEIYPSGPQIYPSAPGSRIAFAMLGGKTCNGVHLVYCEIDANFRASISCYIVPSRGVKWRRPLPPSIVLTDNDHTISQTNGQVTVLAVKDRIIAWDQYGNVIGDRVLLPQQENVQNNRTGNIFLSRDKIYLVTWSSTEPSWLSIYSSHNLDLLMNFQLDVSGFVRQVSGSVTDNKLYLAVALPRNQGRSDLYSTWQLLYMDTNSLAMPQLVSDFPTLEDVPNARLVYYPHQGRTYIISHPDPTWDRCPKNILKVVDNSTGKSKCITSQLGYSTGLHLDGDYPTWDSLQGDAEFVIWCTRGEMHVYRFKDEW